MSSKSIITNLLLCFLGVLISCYAYYVEKVKSMNKDYRALCDISAYISCSKVFHSEYGRGIGLLQLVFGEQSALVQPNSVYGVLFYSLYAAITVFCRNYFRVRLAMNAISLVVSVYLAYILAFVLQDFCIVCVSTYLLNTVLFMFSLFEYRAAEKQDVKNATNGVSKSRSRVKKAD